MQKSVMAPELLLNPGEGDCSGCALRQMGRVRDFGALPHRQQQPVHPACAEVEEPIAACRMLMSCCRNALEDPWQEPSQDMFTRSVSPEQAPDKPTYLEIDFEKGDPVALDGEKLSPATLLAKLNQV